MAEEKALDSQVVGEEDDFTFDIGKKPAGDEPGDDSKKDDNSDDGKSDDFADEGKKADSTDDQGKKDDEKSDIGKSDDGKKDEGPGGKGEEDKGKDQPGKKDEGKKDELIDIFASEEPAEKAKDDGLKTSYKPIASDLGIELETDTPEEFKTKVNAKIESAKQEFKLDGYPEEAKAVVNHLKNNGGKIEDFLNNKDIVSLQGVKNLDPEQKVLFVRTNELTRAGLDPEKAQEQATAELEEWSTKEIKDKAIAIDTDADKLISTEIKKITGDREAFVAKEREKAVERAKTEVNNLKSFVTKQTEFLGIPLSEKAIQGIVRDIETGAFDDIANKSPESSKFQAYMLQKFGKNILETLNKKGSEQNRKGYNAATEKQLGALHKTKEDAQQKQSGHQQSKAGEKGKFDGFSSAIGEDE